jgi:hypothetical protein
MSENTEEEKQKPKSKIGALLSNTQKMNSSQINVYYSQNDWKTSEIVEIIVEENTTVLQLIDSVIYKLKTEFHYDDIDEKDYDLMLLKKKTKKPNYDYPKCNPESLVLDYDKSNFCLVEKGSVENNSNENEGKDNIVNNNIIIEKDKELVKKEEKKDIQNKVNNEEKKENNVDKNKNKNKKIIKNTEKKSNKGCFLF